MRTVHSILVLALVACHGRDERHQAPVLTPHKPVLAHSSQSDLAKELDDADRRGTWGDVRYRWQGQQVEWTVTRYPALCRSASACNVAAFPIQRPAQRGWMPALELAPGELQNIEAACGTTERCELTIAGTLSKLDASGDMPTAVKLSGVRLLHASTNG
jgi:hypothetical protein